MIVLGHAATPPVHVCTGYHVLGAHEWFYVGLATAIILAILGGKLLHEIRKNAV